MKKTMSRLMSLLLVLVMVVSLVPAAMAVDKGTVTFNVDGEKTWTVGDKILGTELGATCSCRGEIEYSTNSIHVDTESDWLTTSRGNAVITATCKTCTASETYTAKIERIQVDLKQTAPSFPLVLASGSSESTVLNKVKEACASYTLKDYRNNDVTVSMTDWKLDGSFVGDGEKVYKATVTLPDDYEWNGDDEMEATCTVTFAEAPTFTLDDLTPTSQTVKMGGSVKTLSANIKNVKIGGDTAETTEYSVSYKWQYSTDEKGTYKDVTGATEKTFTPDVSKKGTTWYQCEVTVKTTDGVELTKITRKPVSVTVGDEFLFEVEFKDGIDEIAVGESTKLDVTLQKWSTDKYVNTVSSDKLSVSFEISGDKGYAVFDSNKTTSTSKTASVYAIGTAAAGKTVTVKAKLLQAGEELTDYATEATFKIKAPQAAKDISVTTKNDAATLDEAAFNTAVTTETASGLLDYVNFTKQSNVQLYESSAAKASKVDSYTDYYYTYNSKTDDGEDLDGIYAKVSKTGAYAEYTAFNAYGRIVCTGKVKFTEGDSEIAYYVTTGKTVRFDADDFEDYYDSKKPAYDFGYVQFNLNAAKNYGSDALGYLFTDSKCTTKVSAATKYDIDDLDKLTFKAGTSKEPYIVEIPFYAYDDEKGNATTGTAYIYVNGAEKLGNNGITAIGDTFKTMKLVDQMEDEFDDDFEDIAYIMFDKLPVGGTLYYGYKALQDRGDEVTTKDEFYLDPGTKELDFDKLYFLPAVDGRGAITVNYTAYDKDGDKIDTGKFSIYVGTKVKSAVFPDVTTTYNWAADAIDVMADSALVVGNNGKFMPTANMARRDLVLILYRYAGEPSVKNVVNPFKDVKTSDYAYDAIMWAYKSGVVTGTSATTFNPAGNITRQEMASMLWRAEGSAKTGQTLSAFTDNAKVAAWALDAMKWAVRNGLINGSNGRLNPTNPATRAEVATILYRYFLAA